MALTLPKSDLARFSPIAPELLTRSYLSCQRQGLSLALLQKRLQKFSSAATVDAAVASLIELGEVSLDGRVTLTPKGTKTAIDQLGSDASQKWQGLKDATKKWEALCKLRFPLLALGLDPDQADTRRRYTKAEAMKAAAIAVAFGLPKDAMVSLRAATSELVWQLIRGALPDVVGKGPFPFIEEPGLVERTLLSGFAGVKAKSMPQAMDGVAARALGVDKIDADTLRTRLVQIGVSQHPAGTRPAASNGSASFAARVRGVAKTLSTPPFKGRVAIAQVYDAYGRVHPDAGSLASFKERLVGAAKARELDLSRLDLPERMSTELRQRSETPWDTDQVHFVVVEWQ